MTPDRVYHGLDGVAVVSAAERRPEWLVVRARRVADRREWEVIAWFDDPRDAGVAIGDARAREPGVVFGLYRAMPLGQQT